MEVAKYWKNVVKQMKINPTLFVEICRKLLIAKLRAKGIRAV